MKDYEQLVNDLRHADDLTADHKLLGVCARAAAAIEALQAEVEELKAKKMKLAENSLRFVGKVRELDKRRLEPKRGEWIEDNTTYAGPGLSNYKCSLCGKICGTWRSGLKQSELPNWCGNCGADMRKMEVQDGDK